MIKLKREGRPAIRNIFVLASVLCVILLNGSSFQTPAKTSPVEKMFNDISWFLGPSDPFIQNWSNTGLIVANDDWTNVHSILGFRGDGLTAAPGVNPQTVLADGAGTPLNGYRQPIKPEHAD